MLASALAMYTSSTYHTYSSIRGYVEVHRQTLERGLAGITPFCRSSSTHLQHPPPPPRTKKTSSTRSCPATTTNDDDPPTDRSILSHQKPSHIKKEREKKQQKQNVTCKINERANDESTRGTQARTHRQRHAVYIILPHDLSIQNT